ncbi:hypothetical protein [Gracilimonas tropica]|uniref:hypothetical protein n=1 Tax=Gracilimonas tropica TaxID=454600 RepID=UPI0003617FA5|nr:hypothetical protein [Gracilimonas tropica]
MDNQQTVSAKELAKINIKGIKIARPYGTLLGEPEKNAVIFIWGEKGAGKSTFSLGLANALAQHGRVEYIPAEEHFGKTLIDRVKRLNATHDSLNFTKWKSLTSLKETLLKNRSAFCVLDSISVIDAKDASTVELAQWCREQGIGFIMVAHATKDGKYKGNTSIAHECDIEIRVTKEGLAETEKNRYQMLNAISVPFGAAADNKPESSLPALTKAQHKHVEDQLSKNESATDDELHQFFQDEIGLTLEQATHWISKRGTYLMNPKHAEPRNNPVELPFTISLKQIDKLHKLRSWKRVNSLLGSKMPCYAKQHSGESERATLSIRYVSDYYNKRYIVELLIDGELKTQICTEGAKGGFAASWAQLVKKHGNLEVQILAQDHAKKVLGAREYRRQEKLQGSSTDCPPAGKAKTKKKPKRKPTPPKKKTAKKKSAAKKSKPAPKPKKQATPKAEVDLEAARKSQAKLDAFLEKVLS